MLFLPKNTDFFTIFSELSFIVKQSADLLPKLRSGEKKHIESYSKTARKLELKANSLRLKLSEEADSTFITPIDREDIHVLARNLDDIVDRVEDVVSGISIYAIKKDNNDFQRLAILATEASYTIHKIIVYLGKKDKHVKEMKKLIQEVYHLENQGDEIYKNAIKKLFANEKNPVQIVKWNELFRLTEDILDECEDAVNTVNEIIIKNY